MASELKTLWVVYVFLMVFKLQQYATNGEPQVPCFFIFGDSLADNGNNNNLITLAKANYPPYGIDFPQGPTGRFTNGRNIPDFIAELLGFDNYIPPFATARGLEILKGVNYASGSAGIRDESGQTDGARIPLDMQLQNHQITVSQINKILAKNQSAAQYLSKCIYSVIIGSNDYLNNYFVPQFYNTSRQYTPQQYAAVLVEQFSQQLRTLYKYGARKVALFGLSLIGCTPFELATYGTNGSSCVEKINNATELFNDRLKSLVSDLNHNLTNANFIYINSSGVASTGGLSQGATVTNASCCAVATGQTRCIPFGKTCPNRTQYTSWDAVHPTEATAMVYAGRAYKAQSPNDAYPFDISHLAQLS